MENKELPVVIQVIEDRLKELREKVRELTENEDEVDLYILSAVNGRYAELVNIKSILIKKGILNQENNNE